MAIEWSLDWRICRWSVANIHLHCRSELWPQSRSPSTPEPAHPAGSIGSRPHQLSCFFFCLLSRLKANGFARSWKWYESKYCKLDKCKGCSTCGDFAFPDARTRHLSATLFSRHYETHSAPQNFPVHATFRCHAWTTGIQALTLDILLKTGLVFLQLSVWCPKHQRPKLQLSVKVPQHLGGAPSIHEPPTFFHPERPFVFPKVCEQDLEAGSQRVSVGVANEQHRRRRRLLSRRWCVATLNSSLSPWHKMPRMHSYTSLSYLLVLLSCPPLDFHSLFRYNSRSITIITVQLNALRVMQKIYELWPVSMNTQHWCRDQDQCCGFIDTGQSS